MCDLPPPAGPPVTTHPRLDPWVEQARREAAHRALRRRRRRRWLIPLLVVGVIALVVGAVVALGGEFGTDRRDDVAMPTTVTTVVATTLAAVPTISPGDLVAVDEVWLVDRSDGVFDWGVAVRTQPDAARRRDVEVTVRLISDGGDVVESVTDTLAVIDADSPAAVAGRLVDPADDPVRIEFDISVGEETSDPALADLLDVRALQRDGDQLTGRVRSAASTEIGDLRVLFVWHDAAGSVIGTAPLDIDLLRPGVDARFDLDLSDEVVPDGRPDAVFWVR
jgi:hypothetical protein